MWSGFKRSLKQILPQKRPLKCFDEEIGQLDSYQIVEKGLRVIEVQYITGSVDKCGVLNQHFQNVTNKSPLERCRMRQLNRKMYKLQSGQHFVPPPINVYLLKHDYYVMDGHRRVACAKAHNIEYLDAYVTECVDRGDLEAIAGVGFQQEFDQETGLHNLIVLSHKYGYRTLLREICACSEGKDPTQAARRWFSRTFCPSLEAIRVSPLPVMYPDILVEDMYVMMTNFYYDFLGGKPSTASPETLISGYLFVRKVPQERVYRRLPSRVLLALLKCLTLRSTAH